MPVKVNFGWKILRERKDALKSFGKKAVVFTGKRSSKENGSLDDLTSVLEEFGIQYTVWDEVPENPDFQSLEKALKDVGEENFDFVVGLGGGSPMDFAKAMAVLLINKDLSPEDLYKGAYEKALPIVAIPTTSGTGSEVTQYSVLTDREGNKKGFGNDLIFPKISFVDPRYTLFMNEDITLTTGLDALCHAVEGFMSKRATPISDIFALEAVRKISESLPKVLEDLKNEGHRENMMMASLMAGIVISQTGTTVAHALGYPLTTEKGVRHGLATAVTLVEVLKVMSEEAEEKVKEILKPFEGIEGLRRFLRDLGAYKKIEISQDDIERWAEKVSKARHIQFSPGNFSRETILRIYTSLKEEYLV